MGVCEGLSKVRRLSVNGPVALMIPYGIDEQDRHRRKECTHLCSNVEFLPCEVVLHPSAVKFS